MAEQELDVYLSGLGFDGPGRKRVAELVGVHVGDACTLSQPSEHDPDGVGSDGPPTLAELQSLSLVIPRLQISPINAN